MPCLLHILIAELMHLIWVLRCESVIQGRPHNEDEIQARWFCNINTRQMETTNGSNVNKQSCLLTWTSRTSGQTTHDLYLRFKVRVAHPQKQRGPRGCGSPREAPRKSRGGRALSCAGGASRWRVSSTRSTDQLATSAS
jgi:hypothetical protein